MTLPFTSARRDAGVIRVEPADAEPATALGRDGTVFPLVLVGLAAIFLPLQNRFWVPGGDSEAYLSTARSLALGHGFRFNGLPVSMFPPGWPALLAVVLHFSTAFLTLKLVTMLCMTGALAAAYWICRRFCSPAASGGIVILCALTTYIFQLTIWLHSDALFTLLTALQVLLALQIRERAGATEAPLDAIITPRAVALALVSLAAIAVRWAAVLNCILLAAILLELPDAGSDAIAKSNWRNWRQWQSAIFALGLSGVVTLGGFIALRIALRVTPQEAALNNSFNDPTEDQTVVKPDDNVSGSYAIVQKPERGIIGYARRFGSWGDWLSDLFWQPARLGHTMPAIEAPSLLVGWILLAVLGVAAWRDFQRGRWIWLGVLVYMLALAMNWQHAVARYLVPVIYLVLVGLIRGAAVLSQRLANHAWIVRGGSIVFVGSALLCNGVLWAVEVRVERSDDFYRTYEAGLNADLIAAARYLDSIGVSDIDIGVSERYENLGHIRISRFGLRAMAMLTGRAIVSVPSRRCDPTPADGSPPILLLNWAHSTRGAPIKWYLYQPAVSPWRVWHFRLAWLQRLHDGADPINTSAGWRLYRMPAYEPTTQIAATTQPAGKLTSTHPTTMPTWHPHHLVLIDLHKVHPDPYRDLWPTHVPGM